MKLYIYIIFAAIVFANLLSIKDGHNWGDDFAQYIINARNIIDHKPYTSGVMLDNNIIYPPGLPILLAPLLKIFGLNFKVFKVINVFSWYLAIGFLYAFMVRVENQRFARIVAFFMAVSSLFFVYKQNVLSDIPFFLFICSSFYTLERWRKGGSGKQGSLFFAGFLFSMTAALWLRSA